MTTKRYVLFSRDDRTFYLFRNCWINTIKSCGLSPAFYNRNFGIVNLISAIFFFIKKSKDIRMIFGTSEICLYLVFSKKSDILIFTGLGRLLQYPDLRRMLTTFFLKLFYRGQKIVALNLQDCSFIDNILNVKSLLINGEGYHFDKHITQRIKVAPIKIAYVGRLLKSKGVDVIINSFLSLKNNNYELYIIGDDDFGNPDSLDHEQLLKAIFHSDGRIKHLGYLSNLKEILRTMDFYVSMSEREGLPFSVLDAIDCGCFILISPVPGHLSFGGLEGVEFLSSGNDLINFLDLSNSANFCALEFDRLQRIKLCMDKFSCEKVAIEMESLVRMSL